MKSVWLPGGRAFCVKTGDWNINCCSLRGPYVNRRGGVLSRVKLTAVVVVMAELYALGLSTRVKKTKIAVPNVGDECRLVLSRWVARQYRVYSSPAKFIVMVNWGSPGGMELSSTGSCLRVAKGLRSSVFWCSSSQRRDKSVISSISAVIKDCTNLIPCRTQKSRISPFSCVTFHFTYILELRHTIVNCHW